MNGYKRKKLVAMLISRLPGQALRHFLYRKVMKYDIAPDARIGFGAVIAVEQFVCGTRAVVGRGNVFTGPMRVSIGAGAFIGRWNYFDCGEVSVNPGKEHMNYARRLRIGKNCLIHERHIFDVYGEIAIGEGTWVAGFQSQFLTHGASAQSRDIAIGANSYLGSAVRFSPGSGIGDRVMLGMGAVVTKRIPENDVVVGGLPAKVIREREPGDSYEFTRTW